MEEAYVISCNDTVKRVVMGNGKQVSELKETLSKKHYETNKSYLASTWDVKSYEDYRNFTYWRIISAPFTDFRKTYVCPYCSTSFKSSDEFNDIKTCTNCNHEFVSTIQFEE